MKRTLEFEFVTIDSKVETMNSASPIFEGLLKEVRELSKKKPEATMNASKVKIINRVLTDLLSVFEGEPAAKYLEQVDDVLLPQISDALLIMVQFESAILSFERRYKRKVEGRQYWITEELLKQWGDEDEVDEEDEDEISWQ